VRRLLVTSAGSAAAQNLLRQLKEPSTGKFFLVAADVKTVHGGLGLAHVDVCLPHGSDPGYLNALDELVERLELDLVIPVFGPELRTLSPHANRWEARSCRVLVSPPETIDYCLSKQRLASILSELGIPHPALLDPADPHDYPIFVKLDDGTGSRAARRIDGVDELQVARTRNPGLVATEYIDGEEFSIDGFADPPGHLVHGIRRTRDETKGGLAVRSTVVPLEPFRELVKVACGGLGLLGFFNLQIIVDSAGFPRVTDVNPRLGGAMILSFAAGLDPAVLIESFCTRKPPPYPLPERVGLRLARRWENLILEPS
jgi:carbamoyl-phosphate synthase large subunit